ncbi:MAG: SEC-C domain-containing protein, partial [Oscillospiraceae bacterium]|nr:SEC-C domain-containing protein [Oscillospiraceae bacterium]
PQRKAMIDYLRRREKSLTMDAEDFCDCIQSIIVIDARMQDVVDIVEKEGLVFNSKWDIGEFASLYQNLNNHTHKHTNRGHTPDELFMQSQRGKQLAERIAPPNQLSFFDTPLEKPKLTVVGKPARNAPCPCGSGRKYKNCCGKE